MGGAPAGFLVFDVGANRGQRTAVFLELGARVVALEPDPLNQRVLARKFSSPVRTGALSIVGDAVSDSARTETFWVNLPGSGLNTLSRKWVDTLRGNTSKFGSTVPYSTQRQVETTTLDALIARHGAPRYIKIDVEGHEVHVLRGLTRPVPLVSFEANLPEFMPETRECIGILSGLSPQGSFNYCRECHAGLVLGSWLGGPEMIGLLGALGDTSVEVFWRSG